MPVKPFYYEIKEHALFDLALFSKMNANENKVLYLKKTKDDKYWVDDSTVFGDDVEAISVNGKAFLSQK